MCVCVCVCVCERERERVGVCVCVCERECVSDLNSHYSFSLSDPINNILVCVSDSSAQA